MALTRHVKDFQRVGEDLMRLGMNSSHSGNLSVRDGGTILITRGGAQLGRIGWDDLVETSLHYRDAAASRASTELPSHRLIYQSTKHRAIIHCHAPYATALSFQTDRIVPDDAEGRYYFAEIPVVEVDNPIGTEEVGLVLAQTLRKGSACIVRSHGLFVAGPGLDKALQLATCVESVCRLAFLRRCAEGGPGSGVP